MLDSEFIDVIQHRIDQKTKPPGSLGKLERLALRLALIQSQGQSKPCTAIRLEKPTVLIFAGDHGIADEGVSIASSDVTQQMVLNFLEGGAAVNCFCRVNDVEMKVIDCGILHPIEGESPMLIAQRLGTRTENFANVSAMTLKTVEEGLLLGKQVVDSVTASGSNVVMFGEMGIANTSSAAAILAALSGASVEECVGFGTGISQQQYDRKTRLVAKGVSRCDGLSPQQILAEVGGYEIVQMVGAFLGAAEKKVTVLVDGFIVSVAALVAVSIDPTCRDYMIFAHQSQEAGHRLVLKELDAEPILDLNLRLGEGTGAVLAVALIKAAAEFYNTMASFDDAGVII